MGGISIIVVANTTKGAIEMNAVSKLLIGAGVAALLFGCAKTTDAPAPAAEPNGSAASEPAPPVSEPVVEAADPAPVGTATISVGLKNGAPYFASAAAGYCIPGGGCAGGIQTDTGNVDLSGFPPGDVPVTVSLDDDAYNGGYRFPADGFQAIGIATWPAGAATEPPDLLPLFGRAEWPNGGFGAPTVTGDQRSVSFTDLESDETAYQYAVAVNGPAGVKILDPRITNGGGGNK